MPQVGAIIWVGIAGLIMLMLGVIGYLIRTGFDGIMAQLKTIWEKIELHQMQASANALEIRGINTRCEERHRERSGIDRRKTHE